MITRLSLSGTTIAARRDRQLRGILPRVVASGVVVLTITAGMSSAGMSSARAQGAPAARAGSYAPGARSTASMNGTFLSVVGQRPSAVQGALAAHGATYRILPGGAVIGPDGRAVPTACARGVQGPSTASSRGSTVLQPAPGQPPPSGDAVLIGRVSLPTDDDRRVILMNASDGPSGVYVRPGRCDDIATGPRDIRQAAGQVAAMGGNAFALAGNHVGLVEADDARREGDAIVLTGPGSARSPQPPAPPAPSVRP